MNYSTTVNIIYHMQKKDVNVKKVGISPPHPSKLNNGQSQCGQVWYMNLGQVQ